MKTLSRIVLVGATALGLLGLAGTAQARSDVYWSVGVGAPGVAIGVGNVPSFGYAPPVYVQPAPIYVAPQPVYVAPASYYAPPRVIYRPAPVYYGPRGHHRGRYKAQKRRHHRR